MTEDEFISAVESHRFPPQRFDHREHLRLAWLYLDRLSLPEAVIRTCGSLKGFAESLGVYDKFHWTVSEALVRIMAARRRPDEPFDAFLAANPDLLDDAHGLIARHYSPERLAQAAARNGWLPPDRERI